MKSVHISYSALGVAIAALVGAIAAKNPLAIGTAVLAIINIFVPSPGPQAQ